MRSNCQIGWIALVCLLLLIGGCAFLNPPRAIPSVSQIRGTVPLEVVYDASSSSVDGDISTYRWSFGDGTESYSRSGTHTFDSAGQYEVVLTIRAADGTIDSAAVIIDVEPAFWVCDENLNAIYKLDVSGNVLRTLNSPTSQPRGIAVAQRGYGWTLFVSCMGNGFQRLLELDPVTGEVRAEFPAPGQSPGGLAYSQGASLWHIDRLSRKIYEINPHDGTILNAFGATYFQASPHLINSAFLQTPGGIAWRNAPDVAGLLWVVESETRQLYELEVVPPIDIFSGTQLTIDPSPLPLSSSLFPISGYDWYDEHLWVVARDRHLIVQVDASTGQETGTVLQGFPGAAVSGLSIQK